MRGIAAIGLGLLLVGVAFADQVVLTATDSKCIQPGTNSNWNDNRFRAYWSGNWVDGFVKFDFTSIPDTAVITAMTLRTFHEEGFGNPYADPEVRLYRVAVDSWARGQQDPHPGLNEVLTPIHTGFPAGNLIPYDWPINVGAANWTQDLQDNVLSLGMRNEKLQYSYVYWHGSDVSPAPPKLTVDYVPEPASGLLIVALGALIRRRH
ncbi:MAG: hypothetical protein AB1716_19915 [Planctomycetota bacterium]